MQNHFTQVNMRGVRWNITWSTSSSSSTESLQPLVKWTTILRSVGNRQQPRQSSADHNNKRRTATHFHSTTSAETWCWFQRSLSPAGWPWLQLPALPSYCGFPPTAAAAEAAELGPACYQPSVTHAVVLTRPWENKPAPLFLLLLCHVLSYQSPVSPLLPLSTLYLSKAVGVGGNTSFSLNNCEEAESAGSNPLSAAQLIITTVCLNAGPDDEDDCDLSAWLAKCDRSPTVTGELGECRKHDTLKHLEDIWRDQQADVINWMQVMSEQELTFVL